MEYTGGFKGGLQDGTGQYTGQPSFQGEYKGGKRKTGEYRDHSSASYTGEFETSLGTYEGKFVEGKMHGEGTFTWPDGTSYHGQFSNGQMTGEGRYEAGDGGVFEDGVYYPDGSDRSISYEALFDGITLKYRKPPSPAPSKGGKGKGGYKGK